MNVLAELKARFRTALVELTEKPDELLEMVRPSQDAKFGDYQANFAMPLGKRLNRPPRDIAQQIVSKVELEHLCQSPEIAGPGFINLRLDDHWLQQQLSDLLVDERIGVTKVETPQTIVIDYSSPNVAKPMHVGHIRSTVIGDALCRTLRFLGHKVISDNHLGDWGTQFGMIIYGYKHFLDDQGFQRQPVMELARLYRLVRRLMDYQEGLARLPEVAQQVEKLEERIHAQRDLVNSSDQPPDKKEKKSLGRLQGQLAELQQEQSRVERSLGATRSDENLGPLLDQHTDIGRRVLEETARLHEGDAENIALWEQFLPACRDDIVRIYDRLDISFDVELGESFYHNRLAGIVQDCVQRGLAQDSEGATCIFLEGFDTPMIIRKRDGAFLYATTDLATIKYRLQTWNPDALLYVVDFRQSEHFSKLFAAARQIDDHPLELVHVSFGTVLGDDGRPFKTRSGDTVGLDGLLDEAVGRAHQTVCENDNSKPIPELSEAQRHHIAEVVGIGALKYADLAQNRTSDYVFSYDKMLAMNGNTATYMQYSYARVHGIISRGNVKMEELRQSQPTILLSHPAERALAIKTVQFPEALDHTVADYRPNLLTNYLFELAQCYSNFFENCPVLKADSEAERNSRLLLCDLTARIIKQGLGLLGIGVVDKM